eukprot:3943097-Prymnesium_polylepis.2
MAAAAAARRRPKDGPCVWWEGPLPVGSTQAGMALPTAARTAVVPWPPRRAHHLRQRHAPSPTGAAAQSVMDAGVGARESDVGVGVCCGRFFCMAVRRHCDTDTEHRGRAP